jgi:Leucine-rich repeat (LRR) protein
VRLETQAHADRQRLFRKYLQDITDRGLSALAGCASLARLALVNCHLRVLPEPGQWLPALTALTALDLSGNRELALSEGDAAVLASLPRLSTVALRNTAVKPHTAAWCLLGGRGAAG